MFVILPKATVLQGAYSSPNRVSFVVSDDGAGGDIYLNGQGVNDPTVSGAVDIATFFGVSYNSAALVSKSFGLSAVDSEAAANLLWPLLDISVIGIDTPAVSPLPGFQWVVAGGAANVPLLHMIGPAVAGVWRVNVQLRHSIDF